MPKSGKRRGRVHSRKPLVSIITVCLNAEKTIARTIESVLRQTYSHIEYLITDGASTDGTLDIVRRYQPRFKGRMRIHSERDLGIYDAMNKGIRLSRGAIIGIINSDDWYEPDAVRLVVDSYRKHGDAVFYGILRVMEEGKEVMLRAVNPQFLYRDVLGHPAYLVAKSIYDTWGAFRLDYRYASDYELMMRLIHCHAPFVQIDAVLANFSQGGESGQYGLKTLEEYLRVRYEYGYLTKRRMLVQISKYRTLFFLKKMRIHI
ncbi:MAG: glycosyltransferase [Ignavibacteriales bacterium]|nr:glycosyltransferase [Ignavibacteriales bacterium]